MATAAAADKSKAKEATAQFEVVSRLEHDGVLYEPGETVELTEKQALPLIGGAVKVK